MKSQDEKHPIVEREFTDPVCGMRVSRLSAITDTEHQGKTYYFCADICKQRFLDSPERYVKHHRQHGVKPK
ncbi:MAG: YHS domain-containing protein [Xanthomonadales bacterium]|nr:YHS domain-containing protein [Xanthomonadales bacterium]NIN73821.1 YHS domain-containing protein [Xanthomonadales bacterium]NIP10925.1 YHS domain-containing protein [Xanthomonadales bacterium]NIT07229.1 YHS domain-containing protein [Xanthomonadales bacterium]NIT32705.1 YHS domain-containing protein [Xanthomonadales bacterium]